jgi:UDP-N-acetyl-D-mannosaminuronic acid dehydrogenase
VNYSTVCVLGLGYIGLPTACTFAVHNLQVVGVDTNPRVVEVLRTGGIHIREPGLRAVVQKAFQSGRLKIAPRPVEAGAFIIAVPTPIHPDKTADLSAVKAAAESIVPVLRRGNLVILESTSPVRTTQDLVRPILENSGLAAGRDFQLAYSPERVLPGKILQELVDNTRVIGGIDRASAEAGRDLYATFVRGEIILTDAATAEMIKLMENTFRDVNIALANELSRLAERSGVNIWDAIAIANRHPRVNLHRPGPGVGGHCISVDPWFLVESAPAITPLVRTAREVNDSQPRFVVSCVQEILGGLAGRRAAVLGLTYKADVDDIRESPAVDVIALLAEGGAEVNAFDPLAQEVEIRGRRADSLEEAARDADCVLLLVAHEAFRAIRPDVLRPIVRTPVVLDCQSAWERAAWESGGFRYHLLGDGGHPDTRSGKQ